MEELELIRLAQNGDARTMEDLIKNYMQLIKNISKRFFLPGGDREDLVAEGMLGLFKAIKYFRIDGGVPFKAFAILCVKRQILVAIKRANKNRDENVIEISIEDPDFFDALAEIASTETDEKDPLIKIIENEESEELMSKIQSILTEIEMQVLNLFLEGYSYEEIAMTLSIDKKKVDNSIYSIKQKVKKYDILK